MDTEATPGRPPTPDGSDEDHFELVGQVIDDQKISIKSVVGTGGFSVVYEGWHHVFDERVAIKCLKVPSGYNKAQIRDYFANFRREGQLLLKLAKSTQNVVRIYNMGEITRADGSSIPYLVLEWLDGEGLDGWLARQQSQGVNRLSLEEMTTLLDAGAEALAKAHAIGVAHRDVKPPNFQVTAAQTVKLIDFGIAKQFDATLPVNRLETQINAGPAYTPSYGAPEQFARDLERGKPNLPATGPHTDVFALALVCVELLTGLAPLGADESRIALHNEATRRDRRPTPRTRGAEISDEVEAVFNRALSVDIDGRYPTVAEFWRALHEAAGLEVPAWLTRSSSPSLPMASLPPVSRVSRPLAPKPPLEVWNPVPWIIGGIVTLAFVVGGLIMLYERATPTKPVVVVEAGAQSVAPVAAPSAPIAAPLKSCTADADCTESKHCCLGTCHECCPGAAGHCQAGLTCSSAEGYVCVKR